MPKWLERWGLLVLFLIAFLLRALYPVSRGVHWYFWSARFFRAILHGEWEATLYGEHPGVMVMWLSGAALWGWYGLQSLLGLNPPTPLETPGYAFADRVAVGVLPLALLAALGIVWGWYLLRRLFDRKVAWVATLLWAIDPYHLANSKTLYLDTTLATFTWLSALWVIVYVRERRRQQLVLSGVLGGLALLTKTPALFLLPFLVFCLLVDGWMRRRREEQPAGLSWKKVQSFFEDITLWLLVLVVVYFALWPSLWVQPGESFDWLFRQGVLLHMGQTRDQPLLYRGTLGRQDPGLRFYLDVLLFRTTFLTLPFALLGFFPALARRGEERESSLLLIGFGLLYFAQMALGSWKDGRYILAVFFVVDLLAAFGLIWWSRRLLRRSGLRIGWVIGALLLVQALIVVSNHPYYGTHYNLLAGGDQSALRVFPPADFGEGLDLAGQYVDSQAGAEDFVVGTQFLANEMLAQHVRAPVYDITQVGEDVDYLVFGVQYTMRGPEHPRWGELWERIYQFREPEFVAMFGDIPYAWVHRPDAEPVIPQGMDVRVGEEVQLIGYRLASDGVVPGEPLVLTLYWRAEAPIEDDYTVFVHLQGADGQLVAQQDNPPVRGTRPTSDWEADELIEDPYDIRIPPDTSFGDYVLSAGMYERETLERLPAFDAVGERLAEDRVVLATVRVRPAVPGWRWALSGIWLAIVAVGVVYPTLRRAH